MKQKIIILFILSLLPFAYQNCGEVRVAPSLEQASTAPHPTVPHQVQLDLCLKEGSSSVVYDLSAAPLIINLTALPSRGSYLADSDMDGVADETENSVGLKAANPRSQGSILDSICYHTGACPATCTDSSVVFPGLLKCDVMAFTNVYGYRNSFDSDNDGVPDFLEIIRGSDPFRSLSQISPGQSDLDQDGRTDLEEIRDQTDPNHSETLSSDNPYRPRLARVKDMNQCPKGYLAYRVTTADQPFVDVQAFNDSKPFSLLGKSLSLSHDINENVIMIYIPLYQTSDPNTRRALVGVFRIKDSLHPAPGAPAAGPVVESLNLTEKDLMWSASW